MKNILFFILCIMGCFCMGAHMSYASESKAEQAPSHTPHPPHDHHDHDHLKYIRGHGTDRKKKKSSTEK